MIEDVLSALRTLQPELRREFHVVSAGVFGSLARGEHRPDSDIDVLVHIDPDAKFTLWDYAGLKRYLSVLLRRRFRRPVDVVSHEGLKARVRSSVEREVVYAF